VNLSDSLENPSVSKPKPQIVPFKHKDSLVTMTSSNELDSIKSIPDKIQEKEPGDKSLKYKIPEKLQKRTPVKPAGSKYRVRHDVIEKSILRAIKNHYVTQFRNFFDFTEKKLRKKEGYSE